ncbi:OmpA family protein [Minwuia thermotolerans]|nr:OmpA family protein [Minwuia thermotolerans]
MSASMSATAATRTHLARAGRLAAVAAALALGACSLPDWADPAGLFEPDYGPAPQPVARAARPASAIPMPAAAQDKEKASPERDVQIVAAPQPPRRVAAAEPRPVTPARAEPRRAPDPSPARPAAEAPAQGERVRVVQAPRDESPTPMIAAMTRGEEPPSFSEEGTLVPRRTSIAADPEVEPRKEDSSQGVITDTRTSLPAQTAMVTPAPTPDRTPDTPQRRPAAVTPQQSPSYSERLREAGIEPRSAASAGGGRVAPGQFPNSVSPVVQQTYHESLNAPRTYEEAIAGARGGGVTRGSAALGEPVVISGEGVYQPAAYAPATRGGRAPDEVILFRHGSVSLSSDDHATIRRIAEQAKRTNARIRIQGHASSRTGEMAVDNHLLANLRVSAARADAVADALAREGIPYERLYIEAKGDNAPIYNEAMPSGEAGNRRAEIYLEY